MDVYGGLLHLSTPVHLVAELTKDGRFPEQFSQLEPPNSPTWPWLKIMLQKSHHFSWSTNYGVDNFEPYGPHLVQQRSPHHFSQDRFPMLMLGPELLLSASSHGPKLTVGGCNPLVLNGDHHRNRIPKHLVFICFLHSGCQKK